MNLPSGRYEVSDEYRCECPECGRDKFYINPIKEMGHCKRCGVAYGSKERLYEAFNLDPDDEDEWKGLKPKTKSIKFELGHKITNAIPAWEDMKAQYYLGTRGLNQKTTQEANIRWAPKIGKLLVDLDPYTLDLPPQQAQRSPTDKTKWYPSHKGVALSEYCFGWRYLKPNLKAMVLCEGIFDILATRLLGFGLALMGTQITPAGIYKIAERVDKLVLWTDPDVAGEKFRNTYTRAFEAQNCEVWSIYERDPKFYRPDLRVNDRKLIKKLRKFCLTGEL